MQVDFSFSIHFQIKRFLSVILLFAYFPFNFALYCLTKKSFGPNLLIDWETKSSKWLFLFFSFCIEKASKKNVYNLFFWLYLLFMRIWFPMYTLCILWRKNTITKDQKE